MLEVPIPRRSAECFSEILGPERLAEFHAALERAHRGLTGHAIWHVNSTTTGGGVAEMLQTVLSYLASAGIEVHWLAIEGNERFFELTKRLHHLLHGSDGDGGPLGAAESTLYQETLAGEVEELARRVRGGDVVVLHDPQVLGLAPTLRAAGAEVIWNCHIGADTPSPATRRAWSFLEGYVRVTAAQVFSRPAYRWDGLDPGQVAVIPPCIDAFATKNAALAAESVAAILDASGILRAPRRGARANFPRADGSIGEVTRRAEVVEGAPIPDDARLVCQISRWDPLKDHRCVMEAFASEVAAELDAHLVLAGPGGGSVDDDPEAEVTFDAVLAGWRELPEQSRARVHLCRLPMDDVEENAAVVNALQRRADVIVQKSLAEGFGLTVAEAMWKGRPVVGSRVGGIQDQIVDNETGLLVDPDDGRAFGAALTTLLRDPARAGALGAAGHRRVLAEYLAPTYLTRQLELVTATLGVPAGR